MPITENSSIRPLNISALPPDANPGHDIGEPPHSLEELGAEMYRLGIQEQAGTPSPDDLLAVDYFATSFLSAFVDVIQIELLRLQHECIASMTEASVSHTPIDEAPTTAQQAEHRKHAYTLLSELMPLTETHLLGMLTLLAPPELSGFTMPAPRERAGDESSETEWELVDEHSPAAGYSSDNAVLEQAYAWTAKALSLLSPSEAQALRYPPEAPESAAVSASSMDISPDTKA